MKLDEKKIILNKLRILKDAKLEKIGRSINIIWIIFIDKDGKKYSIHLQNFFRICSHDKTLITGFDKYRATKSLLNSPSFDPETYDYDVQGENLFDEWVINQGTTILNDAHVKRIELNTFGDLTIYLSNDLLLTIFWDKTNINECWRFFEPKSKNKHLVIAGNGIEELEEWINELK